MTGKQRLGLVILVLAHWLIAAYIVQLFRFSAGGALLLIPIMLGSYAAQIVLLAMWGALAASAPFVRLTWAGAVGSGLWLATIYSARLYESREWFTRESACVGLGLAAMPALLTFGLLNIARYWPGWRITPRGESQADDHPRQFGLSQLMVIVGVLGIVLGASQWVLPPAVEGKWQGVSLWREILALLVAMSVNILVVIPGIWILFRIDIWEADFMVVGVGGPIYAFLAAVLESIALFLLFGMPVLPGAIVIFGFNVTQFLSIGLSVGYLRLLGFRFLYHERPIRPAY